MLLISSELEEMLGLAHRVLVMRRGRIVERARRRRRSPRRRSSPPRSRDAGRARRHRRREASAGSTARLATELGVARGPAARRSAILVPFVVLFIVLSLTSSSFLDEGEPAQHPRPAVGDADHRRRRDARPRRRRHRPLGRRGLRFAAVISAQFALHHERRRSRSSSASAPASRRARQRPRRRPSSGSTR